NSMYHNGLDIFVEGWMGELSQQGGVSNNWYNNNAVAARNLNTSCNRTGVTCNHAVIAGNGRGVVDANIVWQHNVVVGAAGVNLFDADKKLWLNANNKANKDPLYVDPVHGNLALQPSSPAIGYAVSQPFLPAGTIDAGAYQTGTGGENLK